MEVAVIGAGPAGAAAAIVLARAGLRVQIFESSRYGEPRIGEMLPPAALAPLASLGVAGRFLAEGHAPCYGVTSLWETPEPLVSDFVFHPLGHGWHLDRARFDRMLAESAAGAGAELLTGTPVDPANPPPAGFLIDATGRRASIARAQGARRHTLDQLVAIAVRCHESEPGPRHTFVEAVPGGWWYRAHLPSGEALAVFLTESAAIAARGPGLAAYWREQLESTRLIRHGLTLPAEPAIEMHSASTGYLTPVHGPGWVAAGDALRSVDPLSGQGILDALASGIKAAQALLKGRLDDYAQDEQAATGRYLNQRTALYQAAARRFNTPFWQRASSSIRVPKQPLRFKASSKI